MRALALLSWLAIPLALGACHGPAPAPPAPHATGRAGASHRSANGAPGSFVGDYTVTYDGRAELRVEATFERVGAMFSVEAGADPFVTDFEVAPADGAFVKGARRGRSVSAPACATGLCRIRYRYLLRAAAKRIEDLDVASEEGEVLEAPPSTWLLAPDDFDPNARVRFRVRTTDKTRFVTGVYHSAEEPEAWDIALGNLWTSPYTAFGPLRAIPVDVAKGAHPIGVTVSDSATAPARVNLELAPGSLAVSDAEITTWVENAANAVADYFDGYPMPEALVMLVPARGRWVGEGKTLSGGGGGIFMRVGERASVLALKDDWVLVHEMTHLAFPSVPRQNDWAEEGLATYVEPFARARAGLMTPELAWKSLVDGLPNGLPAAGNSGLDRTPTWGRTYWGGALFYLLADVEIRKRTQNRFGLEHALRGILSAGGNNGRRWALDDAFAAGDAATGVPVLRELHRSMATSPHPVDLEALWRELGVQRTRGVIHFDDGAPLAAVRKAIVTPS